jgi:membrane protease YdiL (CAAX protease family)
MQHLLALVGQDASPTTISLREQATSALLFVLIGMVATQVAWRLVGRWFPAQPRPPVSLGGWQLAEITVAFVFCGLLVALALGGERDTSHQAERPMDITRALTVTVLTSALTGSYALWLTRRSGGHWRDLGLHTQRLARSLVFAVVLYVGFLPLVLGCETLWQVLVSKIVGHAPDAQRIVKELSDHQEVRSNLMFVLLIALVVPFLEELIFRGVLYPVLRRWLTAAAAITIDAILFGVIHDAGVSAVILLGGLLAFIFERTRSLVACTLVHALHNTYTLLLIFQHQGA